MIELFKLFGTLAIRGVDTAKKELQEVSEEGEKSESRIGKVLGGIGNAAVKFGKVFGAGILAGAGALTMLAKQSVSAYGEYEQLVGGVETLFKDGASKVQEYADNAYKTAGLSANAYMEQATSFAASLIQSLDGDTAKAADYADRAIRDMSDNANKMGTSMESIQNAYSGFAKQNYTMLDNLKLGYGGTKGEMERLIADAAKMVDVQKELGITVDATDMSFANQVNAISVIQKHLGITGTTALEASETIQGSAGSMKAAWDNLIAGLGKDNAGLGALIDRFVGTASASVNNIMPRISKVLGGIVKLVNGLIPVIAQNIPKLAKELLPTLIQAAASLVIGLAKALPELAIVIVQTIPTIFETVIQALQETFPSLFGVTEGAFTNSLGVIQTIWETIGKPVFDFIVYIITEVKQKFEQYMPAIQEFFSNAATAMSGTWENYLKPTLEAISNFLSFVLLPVFEFVFSTFLIPLVTTCFQFIGSLWLNVLKPVFDGIVQFIGGVFSLNIGEALNGILTIFSGIFEAIKLAVETPMNFVKNIVDEAIEFIKEKFNFEWKLPDLKLPHFKIDGSFSLMPPSVPSFSVDWYAKAMDNPMLLESPTIFGYNQMSGQLLGGGEAGAEVVSGADTLMNMINAAVNSNNEVLIEVLYKILNAILMLDENMGGNLRDALENMSLSIGKREFARLVKGVV
jgi:phage-related protein